MKVKPSVTKSWVKTKLSTSLKIWTATMVIEMGTSFLQATIKSQVLNRKRRCRNAHSVLTFFQRTNWLSTWWLSVLIGWKNVRHVVRYFLLVYLTTTWNSVWKQSSLPVKTILFSINKIFSRTKNQITIEMIDSKNLSKKMSPVISMRDRIGYILHSLFLWPPLVPSEERVI